MKVAVVGSRNYNYYPEFKHELDMVLEKENNQGPWHIISGGFASGAGNLVERYAREKQLSITIHYAKWEGYKSTDPSKKNPAGMIRNRQIVGDCDFMIAFWDGVSSGTKNAVDIAKKEGKRVVVVDIGDGE
jgi:hypothetical protein